MRYVVQRISFAKNPTESRVFVWGEVVSFKTLPARTREEALTKGASTTHRGSKVFQFDAVTVEEVDLTGAVARELFEQGRVALGAPYVKASFRKVR